MHIELLLEEPSAEAALANLLPKIIGPDHSRAFHPYEGKHDLLDKLPSRLQGYSKWLPDDWRIVVLIDEDRADCHLLKQRLEETARSVGLPTKSSPETDGRFCVVNRVAVEEIEAWFFGDIEAVVAAFPRVPATLRAKAKYRDPDNIAGGTWEALERVLQRAGYCRGGLNKIEVARRISEHMNPDINMSPSFCVFRDGLRDLVRTRPPVARRCTPAAKKTRSFSGAARTALGGEEDLSAS